MLWLVLVIVAAIIVAGHNWEPPPPPRPLPRQPGADYKVFQNRAAVHETGHAVAAWCCTLVAELDTVTIEHKEGGLTSFRLFNQDTPESDWCDVVISLAGIAAEIAAYGKLHSAGCEPDLRKALAKATMLVESGNAQPPWKIPPRAKSLQFDKIFTTIDPAHAQILRHGYHMAHAIIDAHGNNFYKIVSVLLTKKTASPEDIEAVLGIRAFIKIAGIPVAAGWLKPKFILPLWQA